MFDKLTLRNRIFSVSFLLVLLAVTLILVFIKPVYERAIIKERSTIVSQLQEYSLRQADASITSWLNAISRLSEDVISAPENTSDLVQKAVNYTPGLMRILITDYDLGQNMDIVRTLYQGVNFESGDPTWRQTKVDKQIQYYWTKNTDQSNDFFIARKDFQIMGAVYGLYMYFDARTIYNNLMTIPLGGEYEAGLLAADGGTAVMAPSFPFPQELTGDANFSNEKITTINNRGWFIYSSRFESIPFWHEIAVTDNFILQPVAQLIRFTFITAALVLLFMFFLSWYISYKINSPVQAFINDVEHLGKLDFEHQLGAVALPEFQNMRDALENIRLTLRRYRKLNVEKLILEEWKSKYMITYSEDLIGTVDENKTFSFVNNNLKRLIELLHLNPLSCTLDDILKHEHIRLFKSNQSVHYPGSYFVKVEQMDAVFQKSKDETLYFDCQLISIVDENSNQIGAYLLMHDRTDEKKMDVKRNEMITMISNELKNPTGAILGISKLLIDNKSLKPAESDLLHREIFATGERMSELIENFLEVNELELGKESEDFELINILQVVKDVNVVLHPLLNEKQLNVSLKSEKKSFNIYGNKNLIFDAVYNIMSNAIKYGEPNRSIVINVEASPSAVNVSFTDFGFGIGIEDEKRVFEKFYRAGSGAGYLVESGNGMGLAYVKEIMRHHNGDIILESNPEIGSKFTLVFPKKTISAR